jgi:hypothetical protein
MVILIASAFRDEEDVPPPHRCRPRHRGEDPTTREEDGGATATDVVDDGTKADAESGPVQDRRQISAAVLEIPAMNFIFDIRAIIYLLCGDGMGWMGEARKMRRRRRRSSGRSEPHAKHSTMLGIVGR